MKTTTTIRNESMAGFLRAAGRHRLLHSVILAAAVSLGLAACGGGARTTPPAGTPGAGAGGGGTAPQPPAPPPPPSGGSRNDAASIQAFQDFVWTPYLRVNCGTACHEEGGSGPPKFAHTDVTLAHDVAVGYANFTDPAQSQMARKLPDFLHNCWDGNGGFDNSTANCEARAAELAAAIQRWADARAAAGIGNATVFRSAPAMLGGSARVDQYVIARWEFKEGQGNTVFDTSGVMPAMDLTINNMQWDPNGGLVNSTGIATAQAAASVKLYNRIVGANGQGGTGEYTIEAWLVPAPGNPNDLLRVATYAASSQNSNFIVAQTSQQWLYHNRTVNTNNNGAPAVVAAAGSVSQQQELQHVVVTFDQANGRRIFINGVETQYQTPEGSGTDLSNWNAGYAFMLGNEPGARAGHAWKGTFRFVAVHDRALTPQQIQTNFSAGVNGGSVIQFDISQLTQIPNSFVQFRVGELDAKSYVFTDPTFVVLDANGQPLPETQALASAFDLGDMRIAINGNVPAVGQTYKNLYTMVNMAQQALSPLGAVLAKGNGPQTDVFQLEFGIFNGQDVRQPEPVLPVPNPDPNMAPRPFFDAGIRNFAQINDTMAAVTGVDKMTPAVRNMFVGIMQQLPEGNDIGSFVPSHEVGVLKLAIEYCDAMFSDGGLRNAFFGGLDPFNQANRDVAFGIMLDKMVGTGLAAQPARAQLMTDLVALFEGDPANTDNAGQPQPIAGICRPGQCGATQYRNAMRAACFAVLSSAAMVIY